MRHIYLRAVPGRHSAKLITIEYRYPADALMLIPGYYEALARPDGLGRFAGITSPYFGGPGIRTPALERSLNSDEMILFVMSIPTCRDALRNGTGSSFGPSPYFVRNHTDP
jgi:hypothetical protein